MNTKTHTYESPEAMVVLFGQNEVTYTDSNEHVHYEEGPDPHPFEP